jgi:two-component system, NarL family, sensor kinase
MNKQGELVYTMFYILVFFVLILIAIVIFVYKSRKKILDKELERKDLEISFQKEILLSTIQTQEKERERIAQDLHDEISSKLNVVSLNLYRLKSTDKDENARLATIDTIIQVNNSAIENARKIAHNLLPPVLEKFGLKIAIEELVLDFEKTKAVEINYINTVNFSHTKAEVQLNIFRIVQELLNNSLKHGKATKISIAFEPIDNKVQCVYSDNGVGFETTNLQKNKGLGMRNIESRIQFLNGEYNINSEKNNGITFNLTFAL